MEGRSETNVQMIKSRSDSPKDSGDENEDVDTVEQVLHDFQEGVLDLCSRGLTSLPSQICNGLSSSITNLLLDFNDLTGIPADLGKFCVNLKVLSVTGNELKVLPDSLGCLTCLQELYLNENEITDLPSSVCDLKCLRILKVRSNYLHQLPENFGNLLNLEVLYGDENSLKTLPSSIGKLGKLQILELSDNQLPSIPNSIGGLRSLKILNLCNNKVECVPHVLGDLTQLEVLDLSGNHLEHLPNHMKCAFTLKKFYCDRNRLVDIPDWVSDLQNAVEVSMNDNQFYRQVISEKFGHTCQKLTYFDMGGNFMDKLPDSFGEMKNLQKLRLGSCIGELERRAFQNGNWLTYLPPSFCSLVTLTEIYLDENLLQELPEDFGNLVNLEFIDLGTGKFAQ